MANWFKDEIDHVGVRLEKAINEVGREFSAQRALTKEDLEHVIRYAAVQFGEALDARIEKARNETSELLNTKIVQLREQLSEVAIEQKRVAIRNASVAIAASILVGVVSLYYKNYFHGELELIDIFRSTLLALGAGYMAWIVFRYGQGYFLSPRFKRNAIFIGIRYAEVLKPKGAFGHLVVLALVGISWLVMHYSDRLIALASR